MGNRIKEVFILQLHLTLYDSHFTGIGKQLKGEGG
jgi:hypothetical protein